MLDLREAQTIVDTLPADNAIWPLLLGSPCWPAHMCAWTLCMRVRVFKIVRLRGRADVRADGRASVHECECASVRAGGQAGRQAGERVGRWMCISACRLRAYEC